MPDIDTRLWPLVIVGRGSSAAFYVSTLDLRDYAAILAIGDGDAWSAAVRGHHGNPDDPTRFINHPLYLITHFTQHIPEFSSAKVDRLDWAEKNRGVLQSCNVQLHEGRVRMISRVNKADVPERLIAAAPLDMECFKIDVEGGGTAYAYKVVMAAGAGAHRVPPELLQARQRQPHRILDLDEFAKLHPQQLSRKKVFVLGPNAAIDGVQKALHYNCKITWLLKPNDQALPLQTQPAVLTAMRTDPTLIHRYTTLEVKAGVGTEIAVKIDGSMKYGDYFVYGMGQTGETLNALDVGIMNTLKPVFDKNQYLGGGADTILAYESEGTTSKSGFEVVGAMIGQIARKLDPTNPASGISLKNHIAKVREIGAIRDGIGSVDWETPPSFLMKDPDFLATLPREQLTNQLNREMGCVVRIHKGLADPLRTLVALLLSYHSRFNTTSQNAYKKYKDLHAQQTRNFPKGAVADAGQLTSIGAAMAAKHAFVPQYTGTQTYTGNAQKKSPQWVETRTTPGQINFSRDNATVIQIGLSLKYPFISDENLNAWVAKHMEKLHESGVGFVDNTRFDAELEALNLAGLTTLNGV